jgi:hypothetical protein
MGQSRAARSIDSDAGIRGEWVKRPFRRLTIATLFVGATLLAACGSDDTIGSSALLAPKTYGSGPGRFTVSFTKPPTTTLPTASGHAGTTSPRVVHLPPGRAVWYGGNVIVYATDRVPPKPRRIESALRSSLPVATGGRMYLLDGMPAIREIVDCHNGAGPCPGKIGGIEVLNGPVLISMFTQGLDEQATTQTLDSFRIEIPSRQAGCRYTVDRKGYELSCQRS